MSATPSAPANTASGQGALRAVLAGIDAAWTCTKPTGVAAAVETEAGWRLAGVAASYEQFLTLADGLPPITERPRGTVPEAAALIEAGRKICGRPIDLVAIDMPMARHSITGRRSKRSCSVRGFGHQWAATHSPAAQRPGQISDALRKGFDEAGYPLRTLDTASAPAQQAD